jgi:nucleoside phosphorylase
MKSIKTYLRTPMTPTYTLSAASANTTSLSRVCQHQIGTNSAAAVAAQMKSKFVSIRFGLMVGIGGGVPRVESDIRLRDVVISQLHMQLRRVV